VIESLGQIITDPKLRARFRQAAQLRHRVIEIEVK